MPLRSASATDRCLLASPKVYIDAIANLVRAFRTRGAVTPDLENMAGRSAIVGSYEPDLATFLNKWHGVLAPHLPQHHGSAG